MLAIWIQHFCVCKTSSLLVFFSMCVYVCVQSCVFFLVSFRWLLLLVDDNNLHNFGTHLHYLYFIEWNAWCLNGCLFPNRQFCQTLVISCVLLWRFQACAFFYIDLFENYMMTERKRKLHFKYGRFGHIDFPYVRLVNCYG